LLLRTCKQPTNAGGESYPDGVVHSNYLFLTFSSFDFLDLAAQTILFPRNDKNAVPI